MDRRKFLVNAGLAGTLVSLGGLSACTGSSKLYGDQNFYINKGIYRIPKLKLSKDRIIKETVGLRPFRPSGPRIEKEMLDKKTIVHNYGHGGSGWSLSWGTGHLARNLVMEGMDRDIALLGCGTVGIATATLLQESGCQVTIYTKDIPPNVTSNLATGTWSPASRVCDREVATPTFRSQWETACRYSFKRMQMMLGVQDIVQWGDEYRIHSSVPRNTDGNGGHAIYQIEGLAPEWKTLDKRDHPFNADRVTRRSNMIFNIPGYLNFHLNNFLLRGGKLKIQAIKSLEDIDALPQQTVVNCTGLGARAIFNDQELRPISGQLACLVPQSEVTYKLITQGAYFITRKDGIYLGGNGIDGSWDTTPDRSLSEKWVDILSDVMREMEG